MSATKPPFRAVRPRQEGVAAVEFALVAIVFFLLFFMTVELARAMYICNVLQESTRRAAALAANTDFTDGAALQRIREQAVFRASPGRLVFADPVSDAHIRIDYMSIQKDGAGLALAPIPSAALPASPEANVVNCARDAYNEGCIRLVRVRICQPGSGADCAPVPYRSLVSMMPLPFDLPDATTIAHAETLGLPGGLPPDPCGCP
jgi:hypothetical protein